MIGIPCIGVCNEIDECTKMPREISTARVISKPGQTHIDEFETLNTIYHAIPGVTFEDLRVEPETED